MDWSKTRVLLVHSDISVRRWAHDIFHKKKVASVQSTRSPETGFDLLNRFDADVAVVQLGHKELSGADFARLIRKSDRSPNADLPIVLIVDSPNPDLLRVACEAGIEGIVSRPTKADVFLNRIAEAMTGNRRFVSTKDYFGPNRRGDSGALYDGPERRVVDLTLRRTEIENEKAENKKAETRNEKAESKKAKVQKRQPPDAGPPQRQPTIEKDAKQTPTPAKTDRSSSRDWFVEKAQDTPKPAPRHSQDDWAEALAPAERPQAAEPEFQIAPLIEGHQAWLKSRGAEGHKIDLTGSDLAGQSLANSDLTNARLRETDLSDADCRNAVLASADLRRAQLSGADLTGADLSVANLRGATLKLANLAEASLRGADLAGADLSGARVANTDFASANMLDADLGDADLRQATGLTQTQIDKARLGSGTKLPPGLRHPAYE